MRKMVTGRKRTMIIAFTQYTIVKLPLLLLVVIASVDARRIQEEVQEGRIINGADAPPNRYPWIVLYLFNNERTQCAGSLIAPDIVLTAAHCVEESNPDLGYASIGKYNISNFGEGNPIITVVARYPHPDYMLLEGGLSDRDNDIAVLKLSQAAINPQIIRMNTNATYPSELGEDLLILGWGSTTNGVDAPYQSSRVLQQATTGYVPFEVCAVAEDPVADTAFGVSPGNTIVGPDWLCTDDPLANHCVGDSGGPIIRLGDTVEEDLLVAVISGSAGGCDNEYFPQINQRVSYQYDWIRELGCQISDAPIAEWGCSGNATSSTEPTEYPTRMPSEPPALVVPTSTPTKTESAIPTTVPSSLGDSAAPTFAPSLGAILQPSTEREDDTSSSPVLVTISTPTSEPTVSTMMGGNTTVPTPAPGPTKAPTQREVTLNIKIIFDDSPQEIGWYISDANYSRFRVAVPFGAYVSTMEVLNDQVSVLGGESYQFVISDSAGNGLSGGGSYEVFLGQEFGYEELASGSGDFGTNETTIFFVPAAETSRVAPSETPRISPAPSPGPFPARSPTRGSLSTRAPSTNATTTKSIIQTSGCLSPRNIPSLILAIATVVVATIHDI